MARFFKQDFARIVRWETMGLLVGHDDLFLGIRCDAWDPHLYPERIKRDSFPLSGGDVECSVLAAFQLVQSDWGQPGLPGLGSVVDNTDTNSPKCLWREAY